MRISDWSSDVCSSDLCKSLWRRQGQLRQLTRLNAHGALLRQSVQFPDICQALSLLPGNPLGRQTMRSGNILEWPFIIGDIVKKEPCLHCGMKGVRVQGRLRSEEHTSELQSLMRISYAVFCLKKKKISKS